MNKNLSFSNSILVNFYLSAASDSQFDHIMNDKCTVLGQGPRYLFFMRIQFIECNLSLKNAAYEVLICT